MNKKGFSIQVFIDGQEFNLFSSVNIKRSASTFIDSFSMTIGNPNHKYSGKIPVGGIVSVYYEGVEFFRGVIENMTQEIAHIQNTYKISGREEMLFLAEEDVSPELGPWKDATDNEILSEICGGFNWSFEFGDPVVIKEYEIKGVSSRKSQVISDILKNSGAVLIKEGIRLIKKDIPYGYKDPVATFTMTQQGGVYHIENDKIEKVIFRDDISKARGSIVNLSYEQGKLKTQNRSEIENSSIKTGNYANRLRNLSSLKGYPIARKAYMQNSSSKDLSENKRQARRALRDADIKCGVDLVMPGWHQYSLLDTVDVRMQQEMVLQIMYIDSINYYYNSSNKVFTDVTVKPLPVIKIND